MFPLSLNSLWICMCSCVAFLVLLLGASMAEWLRSSTVDHGPSSLWFPVSFCPKLSCEKAIQLVCGRWFYPCARLVTKMHERAHGVFLHQNQLNVTKWPEMCRLDYIYKIQIIILLPIQYRVFLEASSYLIFLCWYRNRTFILINIFLLFFV